MNEINNLQKQYQGFQNTPHLWGEGVDIMGMMQFIPPKTKDISFNKRISGHLRLGDLAEQFTFHELTQNDDIELLVTNLKISKNKITRGEIDCLLKHKKEYIHMEIIYKFYLYDEALEGNELNRWIGPNRNDSLVKKLNKLRNKQLPLLYSEETTKSISRLGVTASDFKQKVYFKAQLFLPVSFNGTELDGVNSECIKGHYIKQSQLIEFASYDFYIPSKLDWFLNINKEVKWINYELFKQEIEKLITIKKSPLCWFKSPEGKLEKVFVVWWEF